MIIKIKGTILRYFWHILALLILIAVAFIVVVLRAEESAPKLSPEEKSEYLSAIVDRLDAQSTMEQARNLFTQAQNQLTQANSLIGSLTEKYRAEYKLDKTYALDAKGNWVKTAAQR